MSKANRHTLKNYIYVHRLKPSIKTVGQVAVWDIHWCLAQIYVCSSKCCLRLPGKQLILIQIDDVQCHTLLLLLFWRPLRKARREWGHYISPKTPTPTTNPWKEEKDETVGDKKEGADHANRKALALLLKPASPTPLNTGSLRSFQRDTDRGTKLLQYWEVLQRGGENECLWAIKAPRVTHAGTYGKGNALLRLWRMHWVTLIFK